jgi:hypothetical protein
MRNMLELDRKKGESYLSSAEALECIESTGVPSWASLPSSTVVPCFLGFLLWFLGFLLVFVFSLVLLVFFAFLFSVLSFFFFFKIS